MGLSRASVVGGRNEVTRGIDDGMVIKKEEDARRRTEINGMMG